MMKRHRACVLSIISLTLSGCLYTDVTRPRSYRSATPADVKASASDAVVSGRACTRAVLFLVAWGDSGYAAAARAALMDHPDGLLYDMKSDLKVNSYLLGIYSQSCTIVTGRVGRP